MKTFDEYWAASGVSTTMPSIFDLAMREIAFKAWNAAITSSTSIINVESDQNKARDLIANLTVTE